MNLLQYEFTDAPQGSYNYELGQLVRQLRHYCTNAPLQEFQAALPCLHIMERKLQQMDANLGLDKRLYIEEIMQQLEAAVKAENQVFEEVERTANVIIGSLFGTSFLLNDLAYELKNSQAIRWIEFYGYKYNNKDERILHVIKEIFKFTCIQHHILFIEVL